MKKPTYIKPNPSLRKIFDDENQYGLGTKTLILGMSNCGKSYLGRLCVQNYPRVLVVDIMNEYQGYDTVRTIPELIVRLKKLQKEKSFFLVYQFRLADRNKVETFDLIMELIFYFKNIHVSIEEVDTYCTTQSIPTWFEHVLRRGRHNDISLTMSTQTPSNLNKMILKQSQHIFIGMLQEANDLNYAANQMPGMKNELLKLKSREFLHSHMRETKSINTNSE